MTGRVDAGGPRRRSGRPRRPSRWDDPPPRDWRYAVGVLGRVLIATGLLMFGFVAYQLWGTGIEYARAQDRLDEEFEELLASVTAPADPSAGADAGGTAAPTVPTVPTVASVPTAPTVPTGSAVATVPPAAAATSAPATAPVTGPATAPVPGTAPPATEAPGAVAADGIGAPAPAAAVAVPVFDDGDVIARIEIPAIGLDAKVVAGVQPGDLQDGPGHYPGTPMPGQLGNAAIAGHRTTYGQPFFHLDRVGVGDQIVVTTVQGRFVYRMTGREVVAPSAGGVVATTDPTIARLTLTTCHPRYTAAQRLVVYADLDVAASGAPQAAILNYGRPAPAAPAAPAPEATLAAEPVVSTPADAATAVDPAEDPAPAGTAAAATSPPGTPDDPAGTTAPPDPATTVPTTAPAAGAPSGSTGATASTLPAGPPGGDVTGETADAFSHGWFSDDAAYPQVALWGLVLSAVAIGAYLLSRQVRRNWVGALAGVAPFLVALYFFYQNVNRLLPAAI